MKKRNSLQRQAVQKESIALTITKMHFCEASDDRDRKRERGVMLLGHFD